LERSRALLDQIIEDFERFNRENRPGNAFAPGSALAGNWAGLRRIVEEEMSNINLTLFDTPRERLPLVQERSAPGDETPVLWPEMPYALNQEVDPRETVEVCRRRLDEGTRVRDSNGIIRVYDSPPVSPRPVSTQYFERNVVDRLIMPVGGQILSPLPLRRSDRRRPPSPSLPSSADEDESVVHDMDHNTSGEDDDEEESMLILHRILAGAPQVGRGASPPIEVNQRARRRTM
jgi:hypothetical protein